MNVGLHHIACAVEDIEYYHNACMAAGCECTTIVYDPIQNVRLSMCVNPGHTAVELVGVYDEKSPVTGILNKANSDRFLYHLCYYTDNISELLAELRQRGVRCVAVKKEEPAVLFDRETVSFIYVNGVGLTEFTTDRKYGAAAETDEVTLVTKDVDSASKFFMAMGYVQEKDGVFCRDSSPRIFIQVPHPEDTAKWDIYKKIGPYLAELAPW